jgi:hypothetical protein
LNHVLMTVDVLKSHIKRGKRNECGECPVALAMEAKGFYDVAVTDDGIIYRDDDGSHALDTPSVVKKFIKKFDDDSNPKSMFKPFSFKLTLN